MKKPQSNETILPPVKKAILVDLPIEEAFNLFTEGIAAWWPLRTHSVGEERAETCVFEGRQGGRIYEVLDDGSESTWGTVLAWEPPHRIAFSWHPGRGAETAQEVEILFKDEGNSTRLEVTHGGWERRGEKAKEVRDSYDRGWEFVLGRYREHAVKVEDSR